MPKNAKRTKVQVMTEAGLSELPDDEFMELLEKIETRAAQGKTDSSPTSVGAGAYTPQQIREVLEAEHLARSVGQLLAQAREASGLTQSAVAAKAGVSRVWINQAERKENLELASLVRLAGAMGYRVRISLEPRETNGKSFATDLG